MQTTVRARSVARMGATLLLLVAGTGCRARFVQATVTNDTYRFKAIGSGVLGLSYSDAAGVSHTSAGPVVRDGQAGSLTVRIAERGRVSWSEALAAR